MADAILVIKYLDKIQIYRRKIENIITKALKELVSSNTIEIDFTGTRDSGYGVDFTTIKLRKIKHWSCLAPFGSNNEVYYNSIQTANLCSDISDASTCKVRFRATKNGIALYGNQYA